MKLNIIKNVKIFSTISILIIIIGIVFAALKGLNLGIDFKGGTLLQIEFGKIMTVDEIREITDEIDTNASIVHAGDNNTQIIIKTSVDMTNEERTNLFNKFKDKYNLNQDSLINQKKFGPSIGNEIKKKALISVIIATLGMLAYISYRFEFKFGVAAIIALLHDVLIGISVYSIFRIPMTSSFVAAILTIVGYSINDTIVVFDRIRENIKSMRKETYENIVNTSISQTITRSINTSVTTLLAIVSLYVFGVEAIKDFALPLIVGVIAGTYSSIFIASPVWYLLTIKNGKINYYNANRTK